MVVVVHGNMRLKRLIIQKEEEEAREGGKIFHADVRELHLARFYELREFNTGCQKNA